MIIRLLLLAFFSFVALLSNPESADSKFIVIAPFCLSPPIHPIVISHDSVSFFINENIPEENLKYHSGFYNNIIISKHNYNILFNYLNTKNENIKREGKYLFNRQMIIDYRFNGEDYELISCKDPDESLLVLNHLYCFLQSNDFDTTLSNGIQQMYSEVLFCTNRMEKYENIIKCK